MDEEFTDGRSLAAALRICLVAVNKEGDIVKDDPLMDLDAREKRSVDRLVVIPVKALEQV